MKLSILIPSLRERASLLEDLEMDLMAQIGPLGVSEEVEVLKLVDGGEVSVGEKRNRLLADAKGDYVVFVDDDDAVSREYVYEILERIKASPDCIGMRGIMTVGEGETFQVIYSVSNQHGFASGRTYYRPPGHLTPMRRQIAVKYRFPEKNLGEDFEWADRILKAGALRNEMFIDKVLYHYKFNPALSGTMTAFNIPPPRGHCEDLYVVILSANARNLEPCLQAIIFNEPTLPKKRIIVVDDGAGMELQTVYPDVTWVKGAKPFVFARNANIGIRKAEGDVILLNDDARLLTRYGLLSLAYSARTRDEIGVCSPLVDGFVGNPAQAVMVRTPGGIRYADSTLAFVAAFIPKATVERIGYLDERFTGYGFDDNDYCTRCFKEGLALGIYDGCVVQHERADSTFRSRPDIKKLFEENRRLFEEKWKDEAVLP